MCECFLFFLILSFIRFCHTHSSVNKIQCIDDDSDYLSIENRSHCLCVLVCELIGAVVLSFILLVIDVVDAFSRRRRGCCCLTAQIKS